MATARAERTAEDEADAFFQDPLEHPVADARADTWFAKAMGAFEEGFSGPLVSFSLHHFKHALLLLCYALSILRAAAIQTARAVTGTSTVARRQSAKV
jgi:hypothetical protein